MNGKEKYPHLFAPAKFNGMQVKDRVVMLPMGTNFARASGELDDSHIAYYEARARGGVGLIITENLCVDHPLGYNGTTQLRIDHDCFIPRLFRLTERVHRYGAKIVAQINHAGASTKAGAHRDADRISF